jgi:hypothetical protein
MWVRSSKVAQLQNIRSQKPKAKCQMKPEPIVIKEFQTKEGAWKDWEGAELQKKKLTCRIFPSYKHLIPTHNFVFIEYTPNPLFLKTWL